MQRWWMTRRAMYVFVAIVVLGAAAGLYFHSVRTSSIPFIRRTVSGGLYSFAYPASWKDISQPQSQISIVEYAVNGKQYELTISPPGELNPEGTPDVTWTSSSVTLGGRSYQSILWKNQNVPFYITATPQAAGPTYYVAAMYLPPTDTARYESIFDQVVASLRY